MTPLTVASPAKRITEDVAGPPVVENDLQSRNLENQEQERLGDSVRSLLAVEAEFARIDAQAAWAMAQLDDEAAAARSSPPPEQATGFLSREPGAQEIEMERTNFWYPETRNEPWAKPKSAHAAIEPLPLPLEAGPAEEKGVVGTPPSAPGEPQERQPAGVGALSTPSVSESSAA